MIYLLSGEIESGKSVALLDWAKARNDVYGVLTPRGDNAERFILDVQTKEVFRMEADPWEEDVIEVGRYVFLKSAFSKANAILEKAIETSAKGYVIVDELGKLELRSEGLDTSARKVIEMTRKNDELHSILIIRTSLLSEILKKYEITNYTLISRENLPV